MCFDAPTCNYLGWCKKSQWQFFTNTRRSGDLICFPAASRHDCACVIGWEGRTSAALRIQFTHQEDWIRLLRVSQQILPSRVTLGQRAFLAIVRCCAGNYGQWRKRKAASVAHARPIKTYTDAPVWQLSFVVIFKTHDVRFLIKSKQTDIRIRTMSLNAHSSCTNVSWVNFVALQRARN